MRSRVVLKPIVHLCLCTACFDVTQISDLRSMILLAHIIIVLWGQYHYACKITRNRWRGTNVVFVEYVAAIYVICPILT